MQVFPIATLYARAPCGGRQRGFTLIELVMVLVLVGVLAVFVAPRMNLIGGFNDVGYRDKVRAALEFARKAAVSSRRTVQVTLGANSLTLTRQRCPTDGLNADGSACASTLDNLMLPAADKACAVGNMVCAPLNVTLAGPNPLTFNPLGQATAASYVYTVTGNGSSWTITVDAETGYVR